MSLLVSLAARRIHEALRLQNEEAGRINQFLSLQRFSAPKVLVRVEEVFIIDIHIYKKNPNFSNPAAAYLQQTQLNDFVRFCPFEKLFLHAVGVPREGK